MSRLKSHYDRSAPDLQKGLRKPTCNLWLLQSCDKITLDTSIRTNVNRSKSYIQDMAIEATTLQDTTEPYTDIYKAP